MANGSPVSGDVGSQPKLGDKVRVSFEAEWWETDDVSGHRVYDPVGGYKHSIPPSARVEILEFARVAEPVLNEAAGQELVAEVGGDLFTALAEAARRHRVFVTVTVSPHELEPADA